MTVFTDLLNSGETHSCVFRFLLTSTDEPEEELCNICLLIYVSNTKHQTWLISLWRNLENDASHHCCLAFRTALIGPRGNYISKLSDTFVADWPRWGHSVGQLCLTVGISDIRDLENIEILNHLVSLTFSCKMFLYSLLTSQHGEIWKKKTYGKSLERIWLSALCKVVLAVN